MSVQNVAIVGLGRVGERFLERMLAFQEQDRVRIVACAERGDTPGRKRAEGAGIPIETSEAITARGEGVDIIFDLTGSESTRKELRDALGMRGNRHTVIAPESVARLIWSLVGDEELPEIHAASGY